jgi:hypothetical protein
MVKVDRAPFRPNRGISTRTISAYSKNELEEHSPTSADKTYLALIGGSYGASHSDPAAFDSVFMISGSTGITFMFSNLLSLAHRSQAASKLPLRVLDFVWVVKQVCCITWVTKELTNPVRELREMGTEVKVTIYVTCDDNFTHTSAGKATAGCACDISLGPCCCITDVHLTEAQEIHSENSDAAGSGKDGDAKAADETVVAMAAIKSTPRDAVTNRNSTKFPFQCSYQDAQICRIWCRSLQNRQKARWPFSPVDPWG